MAAADPLPKSQSIAEAVEEELGFLTLLRALHRKVDALGDLKQEVGELRKEIVVLARGQSGLSQRIGSQALQLAQVNENFARVISSSTVQALALEGVEKKLGRLVEIFGAMATDAPAVTDPDPTPPREGTPP